MTDGIPLERKLGYDHMIEMAEIRASLAGRGLSVAELHFAAVREYERRHAGGPTYRERQRAWLDSMPKGGIEDPLIAALRKIAGGHNDPRGLAREVLAIVEGGEP